MNTTMVVATSGTLMALVLIGAVYAGLHFSKKSAQKRRETEEKRKELQEKESQNRRKF